MNLSKNWLADLNYIDFLRDVGKYVNVAYMIITNGRQTFACRRMETDGKLHYSFIDTVPSYNEMICQQQ